MASSQQTIVRLSLTMLQAHYTSNRAHPMTWEI